MSLRFLTVALVLGVGMTAAPQRSAAQGLDELKARFPVFTVSAEGHRAETYMYFPSADLMMKLEVSAAAGTFSDIEFAYAVGSLELIAAQFLANAWYGEYDEATIASAAQQLYFEAKTMKQPFQTPKAEIGVTMDASGLTLEFSGVASDGVTEVSTSTRLTWAEILASQ